METETRRAFLGQLALGLGVAACGRALGQPADAAVFVGIETAASTGVSRAAFFSATGARQGEVALDFRAHGLAQHGNRLVVFPRRPGDRFAVIDRETLEILNVVKAPLERRFYGHGAFSRDGSVLLISENDLETLGGAIGLYDRDGRRLGHVDLPGPGPHEILRAPDRDLFYIAVGGLETHPDYGRTPFNLSEFRSEVVVYDLARGTFDPMGFWPGTEGVSLRHIGLDGQGRLYVGGQVADKARASGPGVLWLVDGERTLCVDTGADLGGYVSSVAAHGDRALASSKNTGLVLELDGDTVLGTTAREGASAVALGPGWRAIAGYTELSLGGARFRIAEGFEFDNHGFAVDLRNAGPG